MHPRKKTATRSCDCSAHIETENLRGVAAAMRQAGAGVPFKGHHLSGRERLLEARLAFLQDGLGALSMAILGAAPFGDFCLRRLEQACVVDGIGRMRGN